MRYEDPRPVAAGWPGEGTERGAATMAGAARRRDGHVTQERMLEEAMAAIAEDGLASLTMSALADRLGTSGGHILYYFGSKDRLLLAALRWSEAALAEERRTLLARRTSAERKLDDFLRLYLPRGPRDPRWTLWIELWARTAGNPELRDAQRELDADWQRDLESLLAAAREASYAWARSSEFMPGRRRRGTPPGAGARPRSASGTRGLRATAGRRAPRR